MHYIFINSSTYYGGQVLAVNYHYLLSTRQEFFNIDWDGLRIDEAYTLTVL